MKKFAYVLVLLVAASMLIAACGQTGTNNANTNQPSGNNVPADNTNVPTTPSAPTGDQANAGGLQPSTPQETTTAAPIGFENKDIGDTQASDTVYAPEVTQATVPAEQKACKSNSDCIPKPECHPLECINKQYASQYTKPSTCTAGLYGRAAEQPSDCSCNQELCKNENNIV